MLYVSQAQAKLTSSSFRSSIGDAITALTGALMELWNQSLASLLQQVRSLLPR